MAMLETLNRLKTDTDHMLRLDLSYDLIATHEEALDIIYISSA
jgi:hypothetical protein|tara:strand:+ start:368 stop:496 length:129 start_codon:yes stop_codon:yes gene_type:complete